MVTKVFLIFLSWNGFWSPKLEITSKIEMPNIEYCEKQKEVEIKKMLNGRILCSTETVNKQ